MQQCGGMTMASGRRSFFVRCRMGGIATSNPYESPQFQADSPLAAMRWTHLAVW